MKLELKHIQHYPIGGDNALKIKCFEDEIHELLGINTYKYDFKNRPSKKKPRVIVGTYRNVGGYMTSMVKLEDIRPILRPMSDLYRKIDGKIGIVELAKMLGDFKELISIEIEEDNYQDGLPAPYYEVKYVSNIDDSGDIHATLVFCPDTCSFERLIIYNARLKNPVSVSDLQGCPTRCYNKFYEYLFENHYDVYDLIGQGLAIDKNTIQD